jgi:hypothetical protein
MTSIWISESAELFLENLIANSICTNIKGEKSVPELSTSMQDFEISNSVVI